MKASELRDESLEVLESKVEDFRKQLYDLRNEKMASKKLENPHQIKNLKKDIARALTIIKQKQANS